MPGIDGLAQQHGASRPFTAETQTLQGFQYEELFEVLRKRAQKRKEREPDDRNLQGADTPYPVGKCACQQSPKRARDQRGAADQTGLALADAPSGQERRNDEAKELRIDAVQSPASETTPQRSLLRSGDFPVPTNSLAPCRAYFALMCRSVPAV